LQLMGKAGSAWVAELITNIGNQFGWVEEMCFLNPKYEENMKENDVWALDPLDII
jgi:hypothetical protein